MKTVLVVGVFDLFHRGHLELLKKASSNGDRMVVVVNGDEMTAQYKRAPIFSEDDRAEIIGALKCVDVVEISNSFDVKPFIEKYNITAIVHGNDWEHDSYLKQVRMTPEYVKERGIDMIYTEYYSGISTSDLITSINKLSSTDKI